MNESQAAFQELPSSEIPETSQEMTTEQKRAVAIGIVALLVLVVVTILGIYFLMRPTTDTERIRDVFIIFVALVSIMVGFALVILIVQVAKLINLINNEVIPVIESANETVSSVRGTTIFLSDNLAGPVIKMNEYLSAIVKFLGLIGLARKS